MSQPLPPIWSVSSDELFKQLVGGPAAGTLQQGLTSNEAQLRLKRYGANLLKPKKQASTLTLLLAQFKSPIILILLIAAGLSFLYVNIEPSPLDTGPMPGVHWLTRLSNLPGKGSLLHTA